MQSSIPEVSPTKENAPDSISEMCQQLTQGLSALTTASPDPFSSAPLNQSSAGAASMHSSAGLATPPQSAPPVAGLCLESLQLQKMDPPVFRNTSKQMTSKLPFVDWLFHCFSGYTTTVQGRNIPLPDPIRQTNPWASPPPTTAGNKVSDAEFWLDSTAKAVSATPPPSALTMPAVNGASPTLGVGASGDAQMTSTPPPGPMGTQHTTPPSAIAHRAPHLSHLRSHSVDSSDMWGASPQRPPTLRELQQRGHGMAQFQSQQNGNPSGVSPLAQNTSAAVGLQNTSTASSGSPAGWTTFNNPPAAPPMDPFDAAWAAKAPETNPFHTASTKKEFTVNL